MEKAGKQEQQISNVFTLKQLFRLPMDTVIEANASAAMTAIKLIEKYGFEKESSHHKDDLGRLRMATFVYDYMENGQVQSMTIRIPFLSLIPLPLLEVKLATFDFGVQIIDYTEKPKIDADDEDDPVGVHQTYAMLASPAVEQQAALQQAYSNKANMDVHIEMVKADLPAGILQLLNLGQQATNGAPTKPYALSLTPQKLIFHEQTRKQILKIKLTSNVQKTRIDAVLVDILVIGESQKADQLFKQPITVETPNITVGIPTSTFARVVMDENSEASLLFEATPGLTGNGFIKVTAGGQDTLLYFSID